VSTRPIVPLAEIVRPLRVLLVITAAVSVVAVLADIVLYIEFARMPGFLMRADTLFDDEGPEVAIGLLQFWLFIAVGAAFLIWVFRATRELGNLPGARMPFGPGWSVGFFFVPVANLFVPYQVVKHIWIAAHAGRPAGRLFVAWWWALFLAAHGSWYAVTSSWYPADYDKDSFLAYVAAWSIADALIVASLLFTFVLIERVCAVYASAVAEAAPLHAGATAVETAASEEAQAVAGAATPAAWYPDPSGSHSLRWWDGLRWTEFVYDRRHQIDANMSATQEDSCE
jgi:hypothetical protein